MKSSGVVVALLLASAAVMSSNVIALQSQQSNVDRDLEEAKTLYREARFTDAIVRLQNTIERLKLLKNLQARKTNLGDAYLHLALSYFALAELPLAKAQLTNVLRSDPDRQLDPQIYAPQVIALFEEARKEVAKEPATAAAVPAPASSSQAAVAKKGGSKAPLILLGAAAAAGGGIAVAKGGGGSAGATPTVSGATPTVSGPSDVALAGLVPAAGSTFSAASRSSVDIRLIVSCGASQGCQLFLKMNDERRLGAGSCETSMFSQSFGPGASVERNESLSLQPVSGCVPQRFPVLEVCLLPANEGDCRRALSNKEFPLNYSITR